MAKIETQKMLSLAQLARQLDLPYTRLHRLVRSGKLRPDAMAGGVALFDARSVSRVEQALEHLFSFRGAPTRESHSGGGLQ
jgi:hypothetical protein